MANTFTTNYNLTRPEVGGANDQWGSLINTNLTTIDSQIYRKVDKADNKGVTHSLTFSGNNITTGTARGFEHIIAGDRIYIANASTETEGSGTSLVYRNRGEFFVDTVVSDTVLTLDRADGTSVGSFASETISSVVSLVTVPTFTRQGLTQLAGEIKLFASVTESVIQALGKDTVAGVNRYYWLACNGQTVSRSTYNSLFKVIGTTFGVGDGSSTYTLPDLRGRVPEGDDTMAGSTATRMTDAADNIGDSGGVHEILIAEGNLPSHVHAQTAHTHGFGGTQVVGDHTHTINGRTDNQGANASGKKALIEYGNAALTATASGAGGHTIDFSNATVSSTSSVNTGNGGFSNTALSLTQPYLVIGSYIIAT